MSEGERRISTMQANWIWIAQCLLRIQCM